MGMLNSLRSFLFPALSPVMLNVMTIGSVVLLSPYLPEPIMGAAVGVVLGGLCQFLVQLPGLHFETCYYQGLDYCLRNGLRRFEPGAQGEHKLARGYEPVLTYSAHFIPHPAFRDAVARFIAGEQAAVAAEIEALQTELPFRKG